MRIIPAEQDEVASSAFELHCAHEDSAPTSTKQATPTYESISFLHLPAELRKEIYWEILVFNGLIHVKPDCSPGKPAYMLTPLQHDGAHRESSAAGRANQMGGEKQANALHNGQLISRDSSSAGGY